MENIFFNYRRKLPKSKKGYAYEVAKAIQNTKQRRQEKKPTMAHSNKTLNGQKKEKILKAAKERKQITYKGRPTE